MSEEHSTEVHNSPQEESDDRTQALAEFQAELEQRKIRAEKGGSTYILTDEDKQKLRQLKFGTLPQKQQKRKNHTKDNERKENNPKKSKRGVPSVNLDDPLVQKRLERFGGADAIPEKSILKKALDQVKNEAEKSKTKSLSSEDQEKLEQRKKKFASGGE